MMTEETKITTDTTSKLAALKAKIASMTDVQKDTYVEMVYAKMDAKETVSEQESMLFMGIMIGGV
jgi:hypothetical protein